MARGKGKPRGGRGGGGGSRFAAESAEEIDIRNARLAAFDADRAKRRAGSDEEDGESGGEEEVEGESVEEVGERVARVTVKTGDTDADAAAELFEEERFAKKAAKGGFETSNPNAVKASHGTKLKDMNTVANAPASRKEREEKEKLEAVERYRKKHEAGLTEEYRKDMAKLAEVKRRRAQQAEEVAEKKAMADEANKILDDQKAAQIAKASAITHSAADDGKLPKIDKIAIKKMKPAAMKEALVARGLDIQGNAKALTARLVEYEAKR